jgi:hypothetical protein
MNHLLTITLTLLALTSCLAATAIAEPETGIEGVISISPVQGGPTRQGTADSRPLANMTFSVRSDGQEITSFRTDDQGHFRVLLKAGHYLISRKDWQATVGFYGPFEADVSNRKMTRVEWKCDTGIR